MKYNAIEFLFTHWQSGVIGLGIFVLALVIGCGVAFYLSYKESQR